MRQDLPVCIKCDQDGMFRYGASWYCAEHKLAQCWADEKRVAGQKKSTPVVKIETVKWIDLSPWWGLIETAATERNKQKMGYRTSRYYGGQNTHLIGLAGEQAVSCKTGWVVDYSLKVEGDGGRDFYPGVNVKAVAYWHDPWLKEYARPKHPAKFYILVGVDRDNKRAWIPGWVTREQLFSAPVTDWGYGPRHSIRHDDKQLRPIEELIPLAVAHIEDAATTICTVSSA